jgi:hypothetical protein
VDECFFGRADGFLDGMELLRNVEAGLLSLDHADDRPKVAFGTLQTLDDFGMGSVDSRFSHMHILSPWRGYVKRTMLQTGFLLSANSLLSVLYFPFSETTHLRTAAIGKSD